MHAVMAIESMGLGESLLVSLLGIAVVFVGLIALMAVIFVVSWLCRRGGPKSAETAASPAASRGSSPGPGKISGRLAPARGSSGEIKLHSVDDRTAAVIMAIVADEIGAPLNELRFISIKEVKG